MQTARENQPTFFDLAVQQRAANNRVLETITREVDFTEAETRVAATYSHGGWPACRVGVLLRVMILQHLYGLSDPQAEEQLTAETTHARYQNRRPIAPADAPLFGDIFPRLFPSPVPLHRAEALRHCRQPGLQTQSDRPRLGRGYLAEENGGTALPSLGRAGIIDSRINT